MTSLAALFSIAGLCCYVAARKSMIFDNRLKVHYFILCAIFFLLSIFSKEIGALNIFYIICIEICFFKFISNCIISTSTFKVLFFAVVLTPILIAFIFLLKEPGYILSGYDHRNFTLEERMLTQTRMFFLYLKWILLPNITELGLYHDYIISSKSLAEPISTLLSVIGVMLIFCTSIVIIKKKPLISFSILFFLASHLLESTILPLELVYEHRNYLASYAVIFGIASSLIYTINKKSTLKLVLLVGCIWICAIATTTGIRAFQWQNDASLALYETEHHPNSARAVFSLAKTYANMTLADLVDEKEKTLDLFEASSQYMPHEIIGEASAILFSSLIGETPKTSWIDSVTKKLNTLPLTQNSISALYEINNCILSTCTLTVQQVHGFYNAALSNQAPFVPKIKSDLLTLYAKFSANKLGDLATAHDAMTNAINISPDILQYRVNFITLLLILKNYDRAESELIYIENNDTFNYHKKQIKTFKEELSRLTLEAKNALSK